MCTQHYIHEHCVVESWKTRLYIKISDCGMSKIKGMASVRVWDCCAIALLCSLLALTWQHQSLSNNLQEREKKPSILQSLMSTQKGLNLLVNMHTHTNTYMTVYLYLKDFQEFFPLSKCLMCHIQGGELFPSMCTTSLAPSLDVCSGELWRERSLGVANKHMHMPPLTYSVLSNLHALMRFFICHNMRR